ncbi:MAG TPA: hypothetical protein PK765_02830 [bacterium]|nr:hypothetical protein [bacterium]
MQTITLRITDRKWLTKDVFEMVIEPSEPVSAKPGQFSMFLLPSGLKRSYSIAWARE